MAFSRDPDGRVWMWELLDTPERREARKSELRALYALCDPRGWDAKRLHNSHPDEFARLASVLP